MNGSNSAGTDRATWWEAALMIRGQTEADQRNIRAIWIWSFVWAISFSAVMIALESLPQLRGLFAWLLATIPIVVSVLLLGALLRFLREADEFMRKVQLEGIAMGYGAGSIFCMGYFTLEQVGAPELSMIFALLPLTFGWAVGSFLVAYRYR
jgi:hypothetical protein